MSVWKKLFSAAKGGVNDVAEAAADSQALRILDQEIREAKEELRRSNHALTQIIAKRKLAEQKTQSLEQAVADYETHARSASQKGDTDLALECAAKVTELRAQGDTERQFAATFAQSETTLRNNIRQANDNLRRMEQQVDIVKATESVHKAQASISSRHLGANSKMKTAAESLGRIQQRQQQHQAEIEAASELALDESGSSLEHRLSEAGIKGGNKNADEELARILGQ
ncbi:PspA/IM30 family protein [Halomonas sp. V046]|uniref:PspA/IM30 family protein n=1 Tax=Halomonas sp. V046 TaxID=3459611 RepID=UPI0040445A9B